MGSFQLWVIIALLVVLHFFLHVGLGVTEWAPDLLTIALLLAARELRMGTAAGLGLVLGLMEDAFSILSFGANAVAMTIVAILGSRTRELFVGDSFLFLVSYLAIGKWTRDLVHWMAAGEGAHEAFVEVMLVRAPVAALYAAALGIIAVIFTGVLREAPR